MRLPRLVPNWKAKLRHAWSLRFGAALAVWHAIEAASSYAADRNWKGAALVAGVALVGSASVLVRQDKVTGHGRG